MAGFRRRKKFGGTTYTSTDKGWTTSTSQGTGKKGGSSYRITTTGKATGKTFVRTTVRGGQGWHKTTQRTLSSKDPYKITKRSLDKLTNGGNGDDAGGLLVVIIMFVGLLIYGLIKYGW